MNSARRLRNILLVVLVCAMLLLLGGCAAKENETAPQPATGEDASSGLQPMQVEEQLPEEKAEHEEEATLQMRINDALVAVQWEENESVEALIELVRETPLTIDMSMYGGFEQVGSLGKSLPRNDSQITTQAGDIVLYSGSQIVVFYGSNTWSYTMLGHVTDQDPAGMAALLSKGNVTITITLGD